MTLGITVLGLVQGIGFRPFVARIAEELGVTGTVCNSGGIVKIIATANKKAMDKFVLRLQSQCPPGAQILDLQSVSLAEREFADFCIVESAGTFDTTPIIPADLPVCENCIREMNDPNDRRYRYPFISCTACGPRYSILERLPYDRDTTTMEDFPMCEVCTQEYTGNDDRRRHAQTISCHDCGPQLILQDADGLFKKEAALDRAIDRLKNGGILAVKGIGGYQFACTPCSEHTVDRLRSLKMRSKKPFAIMFPTIERITDCCIVSEEERSLLLSPARPIVLLEKQKECFAANVSGESRKLGAFLPYTPLHQLLTDSCGPLIMTSGNLSSEPIITDDKTMLAMDSPFLDGVLYNKRRITAPLDDSVAQLICGKRQLLRRSRGYVPLPVMLARTASSSLLTMGGDLKACFCLADGNRAYLSQYFGDLEAYNVFRAYRDHLKHLEKLLGLAPTIIAADLHPGYRSTALAREISDKTNAPLVFVQHHHAHIASVMAEHDLKGCIGVAFDGTGYGTDGVVWGGEFLLCRGKDFERVGHLEEIEMTGGDDTSKDAGLSALCHLYAANKKSADKRFLTVCAALQQGINTIKNTSIGRLFDAASALLGLRCYNSYEGECAIALENAAAAALQNGIAPYPLHMGIQESERTLIASRRELIRGLVGDKTDTSTEDKNVPNRVTESAAGREVCAKALGFHYALADMVRQMCILIRANTNENRVALSGGVFVNQLLSERCISLLSEDGFEVFLNSAVPCNDGGISLGQAWIAMPENEQRSN